MALHVRVCNVGPFFGLGFWGPLYYNHNKEHPKIEKVIIYAPIVERSSLRLRVVVVPFAPGYQRAL